MKNSNIITDIHKEDEFYLFFLLVFINIVTLLIGIYEIKYNI